MKSNLMVKEAFRTRASRSSRTPYYALIGFMIRHKIDAKKKKGKRKTCIFYSELSAFN